MKKIGVFDSGIGGVSVLKELIKNIPDASYLYLSDSKNNPYGDKTKEEVKEIVFNNIEFLINNKCNPIVIACNTATAVAIDDLREEYKDITFIGIEPAIKMVYDKNVTDEKVLLIATKLTTETSRIKDLINKYKPNNLEVFQAIGLAELIENKNIDKIKEYFDKNFIEYKDYKYIILGCTHYSLIKDIFKDYFKNAIIIDGNYGVVKQTKKKLEELNIKYKTSNIDFIDTSNNDTKEQIFNYYLYNE